MMDSLFGYVALGLSIAGTGIFMYMGICAVRYIAVDYRNCYYCPSNSAIFGSISLLFTTLRLCIGRANVLYEQCVESLLVQRRNTVNCNNIW